MMTIKGVEGESCYIESYLNVGAGGALGAGSGTLLPS